MKITVNSAALLKKLQILGGVINSSNTLPILDNFLFEASNGQLTITASDLETTMSTTMAIENNIDFSIAIASKMLVDMLKTFPDQPLVFEVLENNTIEISSSSGVYQVAYAFGEQFPKLQLIKNASQTTITAKILGIAISKTLFATGNDDLRPMMTGVYFQLSLYGITLAATDAHKLSEYARTDIQATQEANFIVPKKPLTVLKNILSTNDGEVLIEYNESNATFMLDSFVISCRLIDAKYPNYKAVIPKDNPNKMIINRQLFLNSLKCVSIFSTKETHQIKLSLGGMQLKISAEDKDYSNKADETLMCNYEGNDMEIGFNSKFLIEILSNLSSEDIQLEMSAPNRAGIIKPTTVNDDGEFVLMLVMPSMLKD